MSFNPKPSYKTASGIQVYYQDAVNKRPRVTPLTSLPKGSTIYFIVHFTEAQPNSKGVLDSRSYLWSPSDGRAVSTHYALGIYPDTGPNVVAYKYASETFETTYTEGYGLVGQLLTYDHSDDWNDGLLQNVRTNVNLNDRCIEYELEANPQTGASPALLAGSSAFIAEGIRYWYGLGYEGVMLGHKHVDSQKQDPQLDFTMFSKQVWAQL
jgi:hypothetical protein